MFINTNVCPLSFPRKYHINSCELSCYKPSAGLVFSVVNQFTISDVSSGNFLFQRIFFEVIFFHPCCENFQEKEKKNVKANLFTNEFCYAIC